MKNIFFIALFVEILATEVYGKHKARTEADLAETGQFPFVVALVDSLNFTIPMCTGSLIGWKHVLTAARCVSGVNRAHYCVMGEANDNDKQHSSAQINKIERIVHHPLYRPGLYASDYDISVLTVDKRFRRSMFVSIIGIATKPLRIRDPCIAIGYGVHQCDKCEAGKTPDGRLRFEDFYVSHIDKNYTTYDVMGVNNGIPYEGDSGCPLVEPKLKRLHGVCVSVSYDYKTSRFINVFGHQDFISDAINPHGRGDRKIKESASGEIRLKIDVLVLPFISLSIGTFTFRF